MDKTWKKTGHFERMEGFTGGTDYSLVGFVRAIHL